MKKIVNYLLLALLCGGALVVSCSRNEIYEIAPEVEYDQSAELSENLISYSLENDQTRGTMISSYTNVGAFGISAFFATGAEYISNTTAYFNGFTRDYYWPSEGTLSFMAYAPILTLGAEVSDQGLTLNSMSLEEGISISYQVPSTIANQPDLLIAEPVIYVENGATFTLNFVHALASISFAVVGDDPNGAIEEVNLYDVISSGTVTVTPEGVLSWDLETDLSDYAPGLKGDITLDYTTASTSQTVVDNDQYLMMIPQDVSGSSFDVSAERTIDYVYPTYTTEVVNVEFSLEDANDWERGEIYEYIIEINDNLPFAVIDDTTTLAEIQAKIDKMIEWGMTDIVIVGGYGHEDFGDDAMSNSAFETLLSQALQYAVNNDVDDQFTSIDLSGVDMYGTEEGDNHLSQATFNYESIKAQITSITLPADIVKIYRSTFSGYTNLTEIVFPEGDGGQLIDIPVNAFDGCSSLVTFIGSSTIAKVLEEAFHDCTSLETVYIPGAGCAFGVNVFAGCTKLTNLWMSTNGTIGDVDTAVFTEFSNVSNCTLFTHYSNSSTGYSGSYYGDGDDSNGNSGSVSISGTTVTITETNLSDDTGELSTSSTSTTATFAAIVYLEPYTYDAENSSIVTSYRVTSVSGTTNYRAGDIIDAPSAS